MKMLVLCMYMLISGSHPGTTAAARAKTANDVFLFCLWRTTEPKANCFCLRQVLPVELGRLVLSFCMWRLHMVRCLDLSAGLLQLLQS